MNRKELNKYNSIWRKNNPTKCREYCNEYYYKYKKENLELWKELKSNGCAICGYNRCVRALHFHHVNPEDKKFQVCISTFTGRSMKKVIEELNKCILLCSNCHAEVEG
jgi:hypothetical protein